MRRKIHSRWPIAGGIGLFALLVAALALHAASTLSTTMRLHLSSTLSNPLALETGSAPFSVDKTITLSDGTGLAQAHLKWTDQRTLAASATENLDLAGVLTDPFGTVLTFAKVKLLYIYAEAANTNDVKVGGAASFAFATMFGDPTDVLSIKPGGVLLLIAPTSAGYAVTTGTGDLLKITNSAGTTTVTYSIVIIGS